MDEGSSGGEVSRAMGFLKPSIEYGEYGPTPRRHRAFHDVPEEELGGFLDTDTHMASSGHIPGTWFSTSYYGGYDEEDEDEEEGMESEDCPGRGLGLLADGEGELTEGMIQDIAFGSYPIKNFFEVHQVVHGERVPHYDECGSTLGECTNLEAFRAKRKSILNTFCYDHNETRFEEKDIITRKYDVVQYLMLMDLNETRWLIHWCIVDMKNENVHIEDLENLTLVYDMDHTECIPIYHAIFLTLLHKYKTIQSRASVGVYSPYEYASIPELCMKKFIKGYMTEVVDEDTSTGVSKIRKEYAGGLEHPTKCYMEGGHTCVKYVQDVCDLVEDGGVSGCYGKILHEEEQMKVVRAW